MNADNVSEYCMEKIDSETGVGEGQREREREREANERE
jgi:hypothetical protein